MLIFIRVSAAKLSSHILPRNASDFTCSYLRVDLKIFSRGETSGPLLTKGGGGGRGKVPTVTGRGGEGRIGKRGDRGWGKRGEETVQWLGVSCSKVIGG